MAESAALGGTSVKNPLAIHLQLYDQALGPVHTDVHVRSVDLLALADSVRCRQFTDRRTCTSSFLRAEIDRTMFFFRLSFLDRGAHRRHQLPVDVDVDPARCFPATGVRCVDRVHEISLESAGENF